MFRWLGGIAPGRPPAITSVTWRQVREIDALAPKMETLDDVALKRLGRSLSYRAKAGEPLDSLLVESFAATREAGRRRIGMRHYDVQLLAGSALVKGAIAEMQTGEGKTLVATLPLVLYALAGKGAHLATVNDYLARRDAEWMTPIYEALGLKMGIVESQMDFDARRAAYACDVTYGTAKEFGFDFLKDRLIKRQLDEGSGDLGATLTGGSAGGGTKLLQRPFWFVLVDEADNVLIDEARTPLIISSPPGEAQAATVSLYRFAAELAETLELDQDFEKEVEKQSCELLGRGRGRVRAAVRPAALGDSGLLDMYEAVERALRAKHFFTRDRQYVVRDGKIVIIDEFTGRAAEGRSWRDGLHQAVEAKESFGTGTEEVEVTAGSGHAARITIQDLFARWPHLAGMTGTIATSAGELSRTYDVAVALVPTNKPAIRRRLQPVVCLDQADKFAQIVAEVAELHAIGRPVLIGTRSIDKSEELSELLSAAGLHHTVLNARHIEKEADIVAQAGQYGQITVSTNMAGRGTDIKLGEGVFDVGGLHVICTELHDSARIDRQLVGRCGRQGDPGTWRQYVSLDDDILVQGFGPVRAARIISGLRRRLGANPESLLKTFRRAQRRVEARHRRQRRILEYVERQRAESHIQMSQDPYLDSPS
ncbi:MAG: preprotein translocase subunit SecA [Planctomycetota bacterium]|nr:MAG: preprotein translocase subunit SecA [Planctomycetota bacterium]